ncbi:Cytoplasmic trehalase (plasmid) [Sodalis praecaptivus]|uniref:Putative periplasmic trehalase n=1 Tax=Sodalis praecaptivus TaxID=1239307 RepID=W0I4B6_9GAMM|nr:Cytoplasmic trehalase [Sodalis praecaptivus]
MPVSDELSPADRYAELFAAVQMSRVFSDSKTFVDCAPKIDPTEILAHYREQARQPGFNLANFVHDNFAAPSVHDSHYVACPQQTLIEHIDGLWEVLTRKPEDHPDQSSLLPLPEPYVVPGGRFAEIYYWDSYFTMLGLSASGRSDLLRNMANNFAYLIDHYGHIPNGNRTYYLSRSQPPVFALMVELFEQEELQAAEHYLPQLLREHGYWMGEAESLRPGEAKRHVVKLPSGEVLNRYWDDRDTPRDESYLEDVKTAQNTSRPANEIYRELRAGAASGWDYSSRWFGSPGNISSIRTTAILPIDLNCFLYKLEATIADLAAKINDQGTANTFSKLAADRRSTIDRLLWDAESGAFYDYDWQLSRRCALSAACVTPLFVGMATQEQSEAVAKNIAEKLLYAGGIMTTLFDNGQQWDKPNGWAPLQWMAIQGLRRFGENDLANTLAERWLAAVGEHYLAQGKLVEKYDISGTSAAKGGGGGEYPLQDGFGWTNGVVRALLVQYPDHAAHRVRARPPADLPVPDRSAGPGAGNNLTTHGPS